MNFKDKKLTYNLLAKSQNKISKYAQATASGLPQGLGPGKTLLPAEKTWDEIASEEWPKTAVYKRLEKAGSNPESAKFVRENKKIYAIMKGVGKIELSTATIKTSHYSDDAPTRADLNKSKDSDSIRGLKEQSPVGTGTEERVTGGPNSSPVADPGSPAPSTSSGGDSSKGSRGRPLIDLSGNSLFSGNQINTNMTGGNATANASSSAAAAAAAAGGAAVAGSPSSSQPTASSIDTSSNNQKYHFPGDKPSRTGHYGPFMVDGKKRYFETEFDQGAGKYRYTGKFVDR